MGNMLENETVKNLLNDLEKRVEAHILEPNNLEFLKKLLAKAESEDEAISICKLGTTYYRTGLIFDKKLEVPSDGLRIFEKNSKLSFDNGGIKNTLIIGDNYDALLNLLVEYRGRIDAIYIDPPYGANNMGEFAETNYENQINRDNLLSMLLPRLMIARQLLSPQGVIFCSIDDKNCAYVKCLFDQVFEEKNFISCSAVETNRGGRDYGGIALQHEYLLIYCNDSMEVELNSIYDPDKKFKYSDSLGGFDLMELRNRNIKFNIGNRPNLCYPFYLNPNEKDKNGLLKISLEQSNEYPIEVMPAKSQNVQTVWRWGKEKALANLNIEIFGKENQNGGYMIVEKYRKQTKMQRSIWDEKGFVHEVGTECVKSIFNKTMFDYPKSPKLIKRVLELSTNENSIVLDFFAGSGTTGQAVLELNKQDGGNRKFILVQLPESLQEDSKNQTILNQIELLDSYKLPRNLGYVTADRLRRIMTGCGFDGKNDFTWIKENSKLGNSLDVFEIKEYSVYDSSIFEKINEELYGVEKFTSIREKIEWVCKNFEKVARKLKDASGN